MVYILTGDLAAFLYPTYASFKALKTEGTDDDSMWLTYWVVFGLFHVTEQFLGWLMRIIPFYHASKLLFLLWCYLPQTRGAGWLFNHFIKSLLSKYEQRIDDEIEEISKEGSKVADKVMPFVEVLHAFIISILHLLPSHLISSI